VNQYAKRKAAEEAVSAETAHIASVVPVEPQLVAAG
jgi:hypothetical protein